ncbi:MAG: metallophosphoesterase [Actinomycetales bacterium]|nr:metallophosphoesterase [Actinomycetales bacterium]
MERMVESRVAASDSTIRFISRRSLIIGTLWGAFASTSLGKAFGAVAPTFGQILGAPTSNSISLSVMANQKLNAYIDLGTSKTVFPLKTSVADIAPGIPTVFKATNLKASTTYYYRIRFKTSASSTYQFSKTFSFVTQRSSNSSFAFTVQGDTHPERKGKMFNEALYTVTLANILSQKPDFHIMLGDDFSIDPLIGKGQANEVNVNNIYLTHRKWLEATMSSVPLYLVNGNHEQAAAYLLDGTKTNPAVLAGKARNTFFPLPAPDNFYSGDSKIVDGVGLLRDYYAWEWGDALFVTLDPYWHSSNPVDNVAGDTTVDDQASANPAGGNKQGTKKNQANPSTSPAPSGGNGKTSNLWSIGIGDEQYSWFKSTLEKSKAKYKFVFAHHVMGTGRGAIEVSTNYEWGGKDPKGQTTFAKERPNWELPIHDLMVKNGVSIFFQGHDHIFVTQERDGLIYQSMPNPADDTFSMFNENAYLSGVKAPNSGHVRVSVTPTAAKVEYFLAARPQDTNRSNLQIAHSYTVLPRTK